MKWIADIPQTKSLRFVIERFMSRDLASGAAVEGFYLYAYLGDVCIIDYQQDTFERVRKQALQEFGVLENAWTQVSGHPNQWMAENAKPQVLQFLIEADKQGRFHVSIYDGARELYDYPESTFDNARSFAYQKFNVPVNAWREAG